MTSSELYHGFGLEGYQTVATSCEGTKIIVEVESKKRLRCPVCNGTNVVRRGRCPRDFRVPPIGHKKVVIRWAVPRVECRDCGVVRRVRVPFANGHKRYTKRLERYVLRLLRAATIKDVAAIVGLGRDVIKDIQKRVLLKRFRLPRLKGVRRIAIDEISIGKGHRYDWARRAEASGISLLKAFGGTVAAHRTGILAWYDDKVSTGPLEGTNNKTKTMKRQAHGYRDTEFFKRKIMVLHETKYAFVG